MKALVFGGTGWVGHRIALALAEDGYEVTVCSRGGMTEFSAAVSSLRQLRADKNNPAELERIFAEERYDLVVDSVPSEAAIQGMANHARGLKHYLHCSSTGGYAPLPFLPGDETAPYPGFAVSWMQKKRVDELAMGLFQQNGFPATIIRPCYISGPGKNPLDNLGGRRNDFIADIQAEKELDVVNDGQALLQPIHVDDLATAFVLAARSSRQSIGQIYNICLEKAVTLNRYLEISASALNVGVKLHHLPLEAMLQKYTGKIDEIGLRFLAQHMCFDITKAKTQLGFRPRHSTAETIEENARWSAALK